MRQFKKTHFLYIPDQNGLYENKSSTLFKIAYTSLNFETEDKYLIKLTKQHCNFFTTSFGRLEFLLDLNE